GLDIYAFSDEEIAKLIDEAVKAGKFNDAQGNPPTTTPTRQDYYDMLTEEAIKAGTIPAGSDSDTYRKHILDNNGYLGTGDGRCANWSAYFEANPTVTVGDVTYDYVRNGNGDWGYFGEATVNYNTGNTDGSTGYYYIFASDSKDYTGSDTKVITVDHKAVSGKLDEPYDDETLNYWLIIANSPNREYDAYASSNVYGNGNVVPGVISVTAYSATKNGYYLYVNSTDPKATDINQSTIGTDTKVYASTQTTRTDANDNLLVAGNIMIFYKEYQSTTTLEYNGFYRYAPANEELSYQAEKVSVSEPENAVNYFNGHYYYTFFGTYRANGINEAKEVGIHNVKTEIWTYDSNGQILVLGKVDTTDGDLTEDQLKKYKWEITPRQLSVKYSTPTEHRQVDGIADAEVLKQYTGKFSHFITVTVSGMALDEDIDKITNFASGTDVANLFTIAYPKYNGSNITLTYDDRASNSNFYGEGTDDVLAYCDGAGAAGSIDTTNTLDSEGGQSLAEATYYTITYYVFAKNAGTYNITVGTDENHKASSTSGKIVVEKRKISLDIKYGTDYKDDTPGKFVFDGGVNWRGVTSVTINGVVSTDNLEDVFGIRSSSNENGVVLAHTALNSTIGMISTSQTDYHMLDGKVLKLYSNDIGTYTATLTISSSGSVNYNDNYEFDTKSSSTAWYSTINSTSWSAEWTIEQYLINMKDKELIVEDRTVYYDGKKHSVDYRIEGFDMNDGTIDDDYGNEHYEISIKADGTGYAGGVNAGTYKIDQISINDGSFSSGVTRGNNSKAQSTDKLINYNITYPTADNVSATLTIFERPIEIQWSELENEFTYNGKEQGVTKAEDSIKLRVHMLQYDEEGNLVNNGTWQTVVGSISGDTITFTMPGDLNRETVSFTLSDLVAINAGSYTAQVSNPVASGTNDAGNTVIDNYAITADPAFEHNYTIKPQEISVAWNNVTSTFKYNGKYQGFDASAVQFKVGETVKSVTISGNEFTVESGIGTEVLHFTIENFKAVNAGTYTANITAFPSVTGSNTFTSNYQLTGVPTSKSYTISKLSISLVWSPDKTEFVYNGSAQGMDANDLTYKLDGTTKSVSISGNTLTAPGVNGETISFTIADFTNVNAGSYTAQVSNPVASGTNEAGATSLDNYSVTGVP
ncbi:MAG: hypothetical protein J6S32_00615, partial [Clostridia bacterium]|nr:hypothetical protein [Clostridia bacterium]